jgi:hypothetical protein
MGMSVDAVPALGGQLLAPRWIVALTGLIFVLCASYVALDAAPSKFIIVRQIVILSLSGAFATLFSWIAFGEGPRAFASSSGVVGNLSERDGRLAFGAVAILSYILVASAGWRILRLFRFKRGRG